MRKITQVVVFVFYLNAATVMIDASGLAEDMGVNPSTGASEALTKAADAGQEIFVTASIVESLVNFIAASIHTFTAIVKAAYAAPQMFLNLGFPDWAVAFIFAPLYVIGAIGLYSMVGGRSP